MTRVTPGRVPMRRIITSRVSGASSQTITVVIKALQSLSITYIAYRNITRSSQTTSLIAPSFPRWMTNLLADVPIPHRRG
ncbi:hypothetical protein GCM10025862_25280 [Arsenicicoccus piscis]|uniref:Uncharacterized protein n=1 Tax=Arsenicicoccus piscis TaxID=673954 RepID=A0ABQ6HR72_9MICO|nr:hypothetical protein GCM10025862_25280 [Arsenicicoccus piscis]